MGRIRTSWPWAATALLVLGLGTAQGLVVTLQQGVNGYTGTMDTDFNQSPTANYGYGYGGAPNIYTYSSGESELGLLQFDLSGLAAPQGAITSATLYLYECRTRYGGQVVAQQIRPDMSWTAGVASTYGNLMDGASHRNRHEPVHVDLEGSLNWLATGDGYSTYSLALPEDLAREPRLSSDPAARWIRQGRTTEAGKLRNYEYGAAAGSVTGSRGQQYGDLASLQAHVFGGSGYAYFMDTGTNTLYARDVSGGAPPRLNIVYASDDWDWSLQTASSPLGRVMNDGSDNPVQADFDESAALSWHTADVTAIVDSWMQGTYVNNGFQIDQNGSGGRDYYSSDAVLFDPVHSKFPGESGYVAADAVAVPTTLYPKLVIDYTPVPEPATMALLGIGLVGLAIRRRRRKQSN